MLAFLVLGIIQGAIIGLLAIGIVLVYTGARVFNFAQAEFGTLAAFFLYFLSQALHLPYLVGWIGAIIAVALIGFVVERLVVRPLFNAPRVTLLVATAGFALLAIGLELKIGGVRTFNIPPLVDGTAFSLFNAAVTFQHLIAVVVLGGLALGLAYFFNKTDLGLAVLATSQESVATELVGISTRRMSSFIWVSASVLGAVAGLLQVPIAGTFHAGTMTVDFLVFSFAAAVAGGVTSLAGAFVGGQMIGIVQKLSEYAASRLDETINIPSLPDLIVFILLLTILLVRPKGLLGAEA